MGDQIQGFVVAENSVDKVLTAVKDGIISAEDALKAEEERGEEARSSLVAKLQAILNPPTKDDEPATKTAKAAQVKVRVNPKRGVKGIAYYDPTQKATIGAQPVTVERTPFIVQRLLSGELVEA